MADRYDSGRGRRGRGGRKRGRGRQSHRQPHIKESPTDITQSFHEMRISTPEDISVPRSLREDLPLTKTAITDSRVSFQEPVSLVDTTATPEAPISKNPSDSASTPKSNPPSPQKIEERYFISASTSTSSVGGSNLFPPPRPRKCEFGNLGREIGLRVNLFPVQLPSTKILRYHVDIEDANPSSKKPEAAKTITQKYVCKNVMKNLLQKYKDDFPGEKPVFDGQAALYTKNPLWGGVDRQRVFIVDWDDPEDGDRKRTHKAIISYVSDVDLALLEDYIKRNTPYRTAKERQDLFNSARTAIQFIEVVLRSLPASTHTNIGRSYYFSPRSGQPPDLGQGCDVWEGYYQSIYLSGKLFINIDTSNSAMMRSGTLKDLILDIANTDFFDEVFRNCKTKNEVANCLANLKIETRHQSYRKVYKINNSKNKVFTKSAAESKFEVSYGATTTTEKYMADKYNIRLKQPNIPCVSLGNKGTVMPIELCFVLPGQHKRGKLTSDQTANMIKYAAKPANERMSRIQQIATQELAKPNILNELLNFYGINICTRMLETKGRVLGAPCITYQNTSLEPRDGSWNLQRVKFKESKNLSRWVILDFVGLAPDKLNMFLNEINGVGSNSGMRIEYPLDIIQPRINSRDDDFRKVGALEQELRNIYKKHADLQLIMAFLSEKPFPIPNKDMYKHIKRVCDTELGILSQCVKDKNLFRVNKSTIANICMKINAKLGGVNHQVDMSINASISALFKKPIMFLGADVNHPHPGTDSYTPSIAAVVASIDSELAKYASSVRFQKHAHSVTPSGINRPIKHKERLENIQPFKEMVSELLGAFRNNCRGHLPQRIIYYRKGVSEGQFKKVLEHELISLKDACKSISSDYQPRVTIICVQNRHHVRLFCQNQGDSVGKGCNVPPGTVLDREITHPVEFDFYLCSHLGLQGTSRPTHYHVLWDENEFDPNSLQLLTYQLCHTYARCTKSVSIPAPVYYSHLVAYRAMMSTEFSDDTSSTSSGFSGGLDKWDEMRKPMKIETGLMYWA